MAQLLNVLSFLKNLIRKEKVDELPRADKLLNLCKKTVQKSNQHLSTKDSDQDYLMNRQQCGLLVKSLFDALAVIQENSPLLHEKSIPVLEELLQTFLDAESVIKASCITTSQWPRAAFEQRDMKETFSILLFDVQWHTSVLLSIPPDNDEESRIKFEPTSCDGQRRDESALLKAMKKDEKSLKRRLKYVTVAHPTEKGLAKQLLNQMKALARDLVFLNPNDLDPNRVFIGHGAFGAVVKVNFLGSECAMKIINASSNSTAVNLAFRKELDAIMELGNHPYIVRLFCYSRTDEACYLIMEKMHMDLSRVSRLRKKNGDGLSLVEAVSLMLKIGEGMEYIHSKGAAHRDLKPGNVLINLEDPSSEFLSRICSVKIADFGVTKTKEASKTCSHHTKNTGTSNYMAPEVIKLSGDDDLEKAFNPSKADVYSFAIMCAEILCGESPRYIALANNPKELKRQVKTGRLRPNLPMDCPPRLATLIRKCWDGYYNERPQFPEICNELRYIKGLLLKGYHDRIEWQNESVQPRISGSMQSSQLGSNPASNRGASSHGVSSHQTGSHHAGSSRPATSHVAGSNHSAEPSSGVGTGERNTTPQAPIPRPRPALNSVELGILGQPLEDIRLTYTLGRKLNQGKFAMTYSCTHKETNEALVCKSVAKNKLPTREDIKHLKWEIQIMHHLSGIPNIAELKDVFEDKHSVHFVMDLCAGGTLFNGIQEKGHYSERAAADLCRVIVSLVHRCHSLGVFHRDLKPENFMFVRRAEDSPLQATNFMFSTFFKPGELFQDIVGSAYYVAPEVLKRSYGPEADIWSAGAILYILLCGVPPFSAETEQGIWDAVLRGTIDFQADPWPEISSGAKDLVTKMLNPDVRGRLTAQQVLNHPWMKVDSDASAEPLDNLLVTRLKNFSAANKMKRLALKLIAESLSEDEIVGLKALFMSFDADSSGTVTFEELKEGLIRQGTRLREPDIVKLMEAVDLDGNGKIDINEFISATIHMNKTEKEEHLFAAFQHFDRDGSGVITMDDLQEALERNGMETPATIEEIIREVDTNNDGRIDYTEFVAMMRNGNSG